MTAAQDQAHQAVGRAVGLGRIPPACDKPCQDCGEPALHYHHANGYAPAARLDVVPLCLECHTIRHHGVPKRRGVVNDLRKLRARKHWSLETVAYLTNLNRSTISRIERGTLTPKPETVALLAGAFGIQPRRMAAVIGNGKP